MTKSEGTTKLRYLLEMFVVVLKPITRETIIIKQIWILNILNYHSNYNLVRNVSYILIIDIIISGFITKSFHINLFVLFLLMKFESSSLSWSLTKLIIKLFDTLFKSNSNQTLTVRSRVRDQVNRFSVPNNTK